MQLSLDTATASYQIRAYESGRIQINDQWITHSVIISPEQLVDWSPTSIADLNSTDLDSILNLTPEVLLLGTGESLIFPNHKILAPLYAQHIGVEIMTTAAACRTYNLLVSEGRRVVAALLIN